MPRPPFPVPDLGPYLRQRGEMLGQLAERHRRQSPPVLAPAEGLAAYHALAEMVLGSQAQASWFTAQPRLREAAIGETLRYSVMGGDVPSAPAQQAWARNWARHMTFREPDAVPRADREAGDPLLAAWRQAWAAWAAGR